VVGDSGAAGQVATGVAAGFAALAAAEGVPAHMMVGNGDLAYMQGTDHQYQSGFFDTYQQVRGRGGGGDRAH
jgi:hypothetical protein